MGTTTKTTAAKSAPRRRGGTTGNRLSLVARYRKGERIVEMRNRVKPVTWAEIAKREGISERWAKKIYESFSAGGDDVDERSAAGHIDDTLRLYALAVEELLEIADEARSLGRFSAATGALRTALETRTADLALRRAAGRLPVDLHNASSGDESRRMFDAMVDVLRDADLPPETLARLEAIAAGGRALPATIDGSAVGDG